MEEIFEKIGNCGVIPVAVLRDAGQACLLADALCEGGLPCAEVTFRTEAAPEAIRLMRQHRPDMLVGAGTVVTEAQLSQVLEAGAQFIVSPGFDGGIVDRCLELGIPVFPGCMTPSDLMQAVRHGLKVVKFFPAQPAGGLAMLRTLAAPFPGLRFMPTGGIGPDNLAEYLRFDKILACGGSWMVKSSLAEEGRFEEIRRLAREAADVAASVRGGKNRERRE